VIAVYPATEGQKCCNNNV